MIRPLEEATTALRDLKDLHGATPGLGEIVDEVLDAIEHADEEFGSLRTLQLALGKENVRDPAWIERQKDAYAIGKRFDVSAEDFIALIEELNALRIAPTVPTTIESLQGQLETARYVTEKTVETVGKKKPVR